MRHPKADEKRLTDAAMAVSQPPGLGFGGSWSSFGAPQALEYLEAEYQAGPPPSPVGTLFAPVPEPNLGEARRSWFSGVFDVVAAATRRK